MYKNQLYIYTSNEQSEIEIENNLKGQVAKIAALSSPPPMGTPKLQQFTKQLLMRTT